METTQEQLALARSAKKSINTASTALKNQALGGNGQPASKATEAILAANQIDMEAARGRSLKSCWIAYFLIKSGLQGWHKGIRDLIDLPRSDWGSAGY